MAKEKPKPIIKSQPKSNSKTSQPTRGLETREYSNGGNIKRSAGPSGSPNN